MILFSFFFFLFITNPNTILANNTDHIFRELSLVQCVSMRIETYGLN